MPIFPRPVAPKSAIADLRDVFRAPVPHKLPLLALSATLTGLLIWAFYVDSKPAPVGPQIIYVESWMADRRDSDILKQQKQDLARYETALQSKQEEFQRLADNFGIEWRADAERNRVQRVAVIAAVNKQLDERIAEAEAREGREAKSAKVASADSPARP